MEFHLRSMQGSILVTGATGFVGSHLIRMLAPLVGKNSPVIACSRQQIQQQLTSDTQSPNPDTPVIDWRQIGNINAETDWSDTLQGVNTVIHCAARVHVMQERESDPLAAFRQINVEGSLRLATQAAQAGVKQFIYLSSVKVNGESTLSNQAFTEDSVPQPKDAYGISKYEAEQALLALGERTGMAVTIIRPPLVYGKGVGGNFLTMLRFIQKQTPLPLASIQNKRSLIYVENLTSFIIRCIQMPDAFQQVFLVSDDKDLSTPELLQQVADVLLVPSRLFRFPVTWLKFLANIVGKQAMADRLCQSLQVDISKAKRVLNWQPPYSVSQGLLASALPLKKNKK